MRHKNGAVIEDVYAFVPIEDVSAFVPIDDISAFVPIDDSSAFEIAVSRFELSNKIPSCHVIVQFGTDECHKSQCCTAA